VLGLAQKEAKRRGAPTWWWVLIAGEGPDDATPGYLPYGGGGAAQLRHSEGVVVARSE